MILSVLRFKTVCAVQKKKKKKIQRVRRVATVGDGELVPRPIIFLIAKQFGFNSQSTVGSSRGGDGKVPIHRFPNRRNGGNTPYLPCFSIALICFKLPWLSIVSLYRLYDREREGERAEHRKRERHTKRNTETGRQTECVCWIILLFFYYSTELFTHRRQLNVERAVT